MDLRVYYQKMRKIESGLRDEQIVVVSCETADGGKPGVLTEVSRATAAKLIAEGRAQEAPAQDAERFRAARRKAYEDYQRQQLTNRISLNVVSGALEVGKPEQPTEPEISPDESHGSI